jgi:hypothetical protein
MNPIARQDLFASPLTRRQMLRRFASGFGMLGLAGLLAEDFTCNLSAAPALTSLRERAE